MSPSLEHAFKKWHVGWPLRDGQQLALLMGWFVTESGEELFSDLSVLDSSLAGDGEMARGLVVGCTGQREREERETFHLLAIFCKVLGLGGSGVMKFEAASFERISGLIPSFLN